MKVAASPDKNSIPSPDANGAASADQTISYSAERIIGNGSFGVVFQAAVVETGEVVAIKKVLQDKRFKNRELQIMRQLVKDPHSNIVGLKHCFYSQVSKLCQQLMMSTSLGSAIYIRPFTTNCLSLEILNGRVKNPMSYI